MSGLLVASVMIVVPSASARAEVGETCAPGAGAFGGTAGWGDTDLRAWNCATVWTSQTSATQSLAWASTAGVKAPTTGTWTAGGVGVDATGAPFASGWAGMAGPVLGARDARVDSRSVALP